jgi:multisubunit Na+/H+ antiporter MnhC subunit
MDFQMGFQLGKLLVILGIVIVAVGLLLMLSSRFSPLGLGKLPGDIGIKGKHWSFYFPIATCLVISLILTAIVWLISFFTRR